jgi:hypothetical protein
MHLDHGRLENPEPDPRTGICLFDDQKWKKNWQQIIEIAVFIFTVYGTSVNDFKAQENSSTIHKHHLA